MAEEAVHCEEVLVSHPRTGRPTPEQFGDDGIVSPKLCQRQPHHALPPYPCSLPEEVSKT